MIFWIAAVVVVHVACLLATSRAQKEVEHNIALARSRSPERRLQTFKSQAEKTE